MKRYLLLLLSFFALGLNAQQMKLTGNAVAASDKQPMIGLTVLVKGTTNGTVTDLDGNYTLSNVSKDATVVFSMIGYKTQEIKVNGRTAINVVMHDDMQALDEVVVIGYGAVKKGDLTSSIAAIKGEELKTMSTGNAMNSLQGKINGVQVQSSGGPGATPRVIIRGVSTVNAADPLYVVDGMPVGRNINFLDQNDIESMQVLKDASAAAIYGTRASNGVILITTKKGKKGDTKFSFSASAGFQTLQQPDMAKASEYEYVQRARYINDDSMPVYSGKANITDTEGTDWWKETLNKTALIHNYNLSFSGGTDKFLYSASIGYFGQDSQYKTGNWQKFTARFSMEYNFNKIVKAGIDFTPKYENWKDTPDLLGAVMAMDPTTPVMRPENEWTDNEYDNYSRSHNSQVWNPVASMARLSKNTDEYGLLANPYISIEPIKGLVVRSQFGINARFRLFDEFSPEFHLDNLEQATANTAKREMKNWVDWNWTNTITWMKTFNEKHNINLMGGYTMERYQYYWLTGSRDGVPTNNDELLQYVKGGTKKPQAEGLNEYNSMISYLGRIIYNYNDRYYLTASVRVDGSSRFPKGNKYATFPAVSAAWRISGEPFMKNQHIFDNLKLRAGWGRVGNEDIDNSAYQSSIGGSDYVFGPNADRVIGTSVASIGNNSVRWETVEDYSIGVDMAFLNNRLSVTAEWFRKESKDMLMKKANLLVLGYPMWNGEMWENVGSMQATGWELSVNWNDHKGDFSYEVGVNLSSVKNKAKKLMGGDTPIYTGSFNGDYIIRNEEGGEISRFYGYVADGIFQNQTEVNAHTNEYGSVIQPNALPGDIRFKDLNGDGKLDDKDKAYIGSAFPDLMVGINGRVSYKNLDFMANFYGTIGNDVFNTTKGRYSGAGGENVYAGTYNSSWHGEGTSNSLPRLSVNDSNMNWKRPSSFFVEDGSYLRCKMLQIGYTLPKRWTKDIVLRLSFSAQNPFTITGYSGMDPEAVSVGKGVTEMGIDWASYPNPRTYLFGLNINF
ncbi:SusC/RagA family TonB-linked outer membrane protein [Bacteroides congonensis]|uniref:SusC/RagA family TonB-linked outer membrane protein n=1 Tax=Bacteroides congonensis TaxID=1871006 RepID=UPI002674638C|nr:TonB-dependent receptor [Bacteroides congonensis]